MKQQLCWFRTDLRVSDNKALSAALSAGPTTAIYIATPEQWLAHDDAPIKIDFWHRNLIELHTSLKRLNVELLIFSVPTYDDVKKVFANIFNHHGFEGLHLNKEYPINEQARDSDIIAVCNEYQTKITLHDDQLLARPLSVLTQSGMPFKVFTPFSNKIKKVLYNAGSTAQCPTPQPQKISPKQIENLPSQCQLEQVDWPENNPSWAKHWPAGEKIALKRLDAFCSLTINDYKVKRNIPSIAGTSSLSPYLASGIISIRECWLQAHYYADNEGTLTWQTELLWREFYKHVVVHFPYVCEHLPWKRSTANIQWCTDDEAFNKWCNGKTGFPLIDAAMRQLIETGWMHNRLRMITAMFLSKQLLLDWRLGERWFMQHLIDGDFSANNGGWQWSSSTGTDSVPYFRIFNPLRQSQQYDPEGKFIKHYLPELSQIDSKQVHGPIINMNVDYPEPIIDLKFARERALNTFKQQ